MDKLAKLLKKLTSKESNQLAKTLRALLSGETDSLDIKKLKGVDNVYRVRVGNLRIIFRREKRDIRVLEVSRRDDTTYRAL